MAWSWVYGCANCTWQELAIVCGLAVLAFAVWWCGLHWMARKYEKQLTASIPEKSPPHTFKDLDEGKHEVEMHYVEPKTGEVIAKKEEVEIKQGQRVICKLYFKEVKTLA